MLIQERSKDDAHVETIFWHLTHMTVMVPTNYTSRKSMGVGGSMALLVGEMGELFGRRVALPPSCFLSCCLPWRASLKLRAPLASTQRLKSALIQWTYLNKAATPKLTETKRNDRMQIFETHI
eukprot:1091621-Amphidinium_carterae.1